MSSSSKPACDGTGLQQTIGGLVREFFEMLSQGEAGQNGGSLGCLCLADLHNDLRRYK